MLKLIGYAGPLLLDFSLSQKNVFYTATVCINVKHQVEKNYVVFYRSLYTHTHIGFGVMLKYVI